METIDPASLPFFITESIYLVNEPEPFLSEEEKAVIEYEQEKESAEKKPVLNFKGDNKKEILILVDDENQKYLTKEDEEFLVKILGAVGLSFTDIALVNLYSLREQLPYFPDAYSLLHDFPYQSFILFGEIDEKLPFSGNFTKYQILTADSEKNYLQADLLSNIATDRNKKQLLWKNLRELFSV